MSTTYITVMVDVDGGSAEFPGALAQDKNCEGCGEAADIEFMGATGAMFAFCLPCAFADGGDITGIRKA